MITIQRKTQIIKRKKDRKYSLDRLFAFMMASLATLLFLTLFGIGCKKEQVRYSTAQIPLYKEADLNKKKKALTFIQKGEKVYQISQKGATTEDVMMVKLSDGKVGYVKSRYMAQSCFVISTPTVQLKKRPGRTAPDSSSHDKIKVSSVAFVIGITESKDEGLWYEVKGGYTANYFSGWLPENTPVIRDPEVIQYGIQLEQAIQKKNKEKLEGLLEKAYPIGETAAAFLSQLFPETDTGEGESLEGEEPEGEVGKEKEDETEREAGKEEPERG